ncbi:MAG TPA: inositol monophosphatase [Candidatus Magasanikbacteria bacterium]|nr:inositol monophosphatase [Candidatus Magasanikbacteria bacterium]
MPTHKEFAINLAQQAGAIIRENFALGMNRTLKKDNTPVTATDLAINTLLLKSVRETFPDHNVLAEEESDMSQKSEFVWVCDPLDGTIPFSHGLTICTFSLALVKNGESILGVVYDPFQDNMFVAEKGKGAFLNDKKISVSNADTFSGAVANCEYFNTAIYNTSKCALHMQMIEGVQTMRLSSFIISAVLVAAGELSFAIYPSSYAHDAAAAKIIVEEAGGKATDLFGNEQRYDRAINGFLVSNGLLHEKVLKIIKETVTRI